MAVEPQMRTYKIYDEQNNVKSAWSKGLKSSFANFITADNSVSDDILVTYNI